MRSLCLLAVLGVLFCIFLLSAGCEDSPEVQPPRAAEQPSTIKDSVSEDIRKGQQSPLPGY